MARLLKGTATAVPASGLAENMTTLGYNYVQEAGKSTLLCGAITIPSLTVNGNLNVTTQLNVTTDLDIGSAGTLNIIG